MIDPTNITNFNRSEGELQKFLIFCICVAGKNSMMVAKKLNDWYLMRYEQPFNHLSRLTKEEMMEELRDIRIGQYNRISNALYGIIFHTLTFPLSTIPLSTLEAINGIGPKTARFFLLHSRPNQRLAVLDTHILRFMRQNGLADTPKSTPSGRRYLALEKIWLDFCDRNNVSSEAMDLMVWKEGSKNVHPV